MAWRQHLHRLAACDLVLDNFHYTSHTTATDVLWQWVPLLTLFGEECTTSSLATLIIVIVMVMIDFSALLFVVRHMELSVLCGLVHEEPMSDSLQCDVC